jgi:hypothetical protein
MYFNECSTKLKFNNTSTIYSAKEHLKNYPSFQFNAEFADAQPDSWRNHKSICTRATTKDTAGLRTYLNIIYIFLSEFILHLTLFKSIIKYMGLNKILPTNHF